MTDPITLHKEIQGVVVNGATLSSHTFPVEVPGPLEVQVRLHAASLNARDQMIRKGQYGEMPADLVALSDGAGEVIAVGDKVTKWSVGDRVMPTFFQQWLEGPFVPHMLGSASAPLNTPASLESKPISMRIRWFVSPTT